MFGCFRIQIYIIRKVNDFNQLNEKAIDFVNKCVTMNLLITYKQLRVRLNISLQVGIVKQVMFIHFTAT